MNTGVILIVLITYLIGEIYKFIFRNKEEYYRLIPIIVTIIGGLVGILLYYTANDLLLQASHVYDALLFGFVSGASATGTNQIIKSIFKQNDYTEIDDSDNKEE